MSGRTPPSRCVAFDIGGTSIRAGHFDAKKGALVATERRATPNHLANPTLSIEELRDQMFAAMEEMARALLGGQLPDLVGFAFPGPIDAAGNVLSVPTAFGPRSTSPRPIGRELGERWPG